ncbi:hypothetical protein E7747_16205 (plasmid) [Duncaniella dubosii]|uniref:Uncharacterized protein n=1 Tax=Duncaniella dubosii TaxID=2518971 RepID=A0A4P7W6R3_9BACT|nr:hypothetical protein [Duncaniella dubosii]QCD43794.1 hypothetical protein E7747_16205 [Duncaniella dubosii]
MAVILQHQKINQKRHIKMTKFTISCHRNDNGSISGDGAGIERPTLSSQSIKLEITQLRTHNTGVHRAPKHISIEAFYDAESNSIDISYDGENDGEVFVLWVKI